MGKKRPQITTVKRASCALVKFDSVLYRSFIPRLRPSLRPRAPSSSSTYARACIHSSSTSGRHSARQHADRFFFSVFLLRFFLSRPDLRAGDFYCAYRVNAPLNSSLAEAPSETISLVVVVAGTARRGHVIEREFMNTTS